MTTRSLFRSLAVAAAVGAGCSNAGDPPDPSPTILTVSAAASLQEVLAQIAREYESAHPAVRLRLNFASSGTLQQQIHLGAPVDVFLSAADAQMDALEAEGMIDPDTRRSFASNELVLIVPSTASSGADDFTDLAAARVRRVALGAPASVPAGRYAEQVLRTLGIADAVLGKALLGQHVRQVLTYVERGEVDAGIVYRTDAARRSRVRIVAGAPPGSHDEITYPLAVIATSRQPQAARSFAEYLLAPEAQTALRRFGFRPAEGSDSTLARTAP